MSSHHRPFTPTCDLCDAHRDASEDSFRVLPGVFRHFGAHKQFAGPISTIKCFEDNTSVRTAVQSPGNGRVLVVDGGASMRRALVGGNLAAAAADNGWAGIVVDGAVRDIAEIAACTVGICALGTVPMPSVRKAEGQVDVPVVIQGLWVRPGEWLVADEDGIVVMQGR